MNRFRQSYLFILFFTVLFSCRTSFVPTEAVHHHYRITTSVPRDSAMQLLMKPYSDSINETMNAVIGYAETTLEKQQPSGTLGNFLADALLHMARQKFNVPVHAAFINYGGIRITQLPKGDVTIGKIYEVMPFDNLLILQRMKGSVLKEFLDLTAVKGGWPMAGISMQILDKRAVNIRINGEPLDLNKTYTIANSDYIATGGDNANMLTTIPQENIGYLMREAFLDYIKALKAEGKNISAKEENRVTNAQ